MLETLTVYVLWYDDMFQGVYATSDAAMRAADNTEKRATVWTAEKKATDDPASIIRWNNNASWTVERVTVED